MVKIMVIGCGNLLASDDGAGIQVLRRLQEKELPQEVKIVEAGTPGLQLLDIWAETERLIIIDAVRSGAAPGTIHCFDSSLLPPRDFLPLSSHGINVIDALQLGLKLGKIPEQVVIVGIEILSEEPYVEGLTAPVTQALDSAVDMVIEQVNRLLAR